MQYYLRITTLILIFFLPICLFAQTEGVGLWTTLSIDKKIVKNLTLNLNGQARFTEDVARMSSYFGEAGLSYNLTKNFTIAAYYRYLNKSDWKPKKQIYVFEPFHRFYAEAEYSKKWDKFKISNRLRFQEQFKDTDAGLSNQKNYLRNKLELAYSVNKKFTPYVSADLFYRMGDTFDQIRAKAGVEYKINKHNGLDFAIFNDLPLNEEEKVNSMIFAVAYKFKF